jgi:hypothetical protein
MKLKPDKSVSIFLSPYPFLCSHLPEAKIALWELATFTEKELSSSIHNGKQLQQDGRKKVKQHKKCKLHSQP